ncbi:MAG: cobalamin B12-binding domain-containing protein [Chloroflexi bacterium]|nr:cobalamin B12-binding domain-containing protein [Chloroflexota bacterium]
MRTTLIYAGISGTGFKTLGQGMEGGWISHGLAILSASAKEKGFDVDLIDLRVLPNWDGFRNEIKARQPTVCGLTMMSVDYNPVMKCIEIIKQVNPAIITVVGGPHPTILPQEVLSNSKVDYIVTGEGEITFPQLLSAIAQGNQPPERLLPGIHPDLDTLPIADRHLFLEEWRRAGYDANSPEIPFVPDLPSPFVTIIAGRGCRYHCNFCKPAEDYLFGKGTRRRSVEHVMAELRHLRDRFHFASFMFHDDCLPEDRPWVMEFCRAYRAEGFTQPFFCQSRAEIILYHEDMVRLMVEAGLKGYFVGFESGSDRMLRFLRKGTTREVNIAAAKICQKYGITIWANYMLGLPTETEDEVRETISMLKEIDPDYYSPAFYTPHPGSDLYNYCTEHDLSLIADYDSYRRNPTEPKIKGLDFDFLKWALTESQRRTPWNALKRKARYLWKRYASPSKAVRRVKRLAVVRS